MEVSESGYTTVCTTNSSIEEHDVNVIHEPVIAVDINTEEHVFIESMNCEIVTEIIEQDPTLTVGSRFYDFQSFENALNLYSLANNLVYTIQKSARISRRNKARREKNYKLYNPKLKYSSLVMGCKHFGSKRSRNKGIRPKQSTYKTGCNSQIVLGFDSATQALVVTRFITEHNHDVSLDMAENYPERRRLSMEETLFMEERLRDPGLKAKQVQAIVRSTLHKHVSSKDVHNFRASLKRPRKEPPVVEEFDEEEILKPGEPALPPRTPGPKRPRVRKPRTNRVAKAVVSAPREQRTKRTVVLYKVPDAPHPEDDDPTAADAEPTEYGSETDADDVHQFDDGDTAWAEAEVSGQAVADVSIKEEAESGDDDDDRYECVEYLEPDFADAGPEVGAAQSIADVNDSWKCVYKLLEADNAALRRDCAKLRRQLAALEQLACANCGGTART